MTSSKDNREVIGNNKRPIDNTVGLDFLNNQIIETLDTANVFGDIRIPISLGLVPGVSIFKISGLNEDIDTNDREDIISQGGNYQWLLNADTLEVLSTEADDTLLGIGARKIRIVGLDELYNEIEEIVSLNGLTVVGTVQSFLRINLVAVVSVGSNDFNVGEISINGATLGNTLSHIPIDDSNTGLNKSFQTIFTVPLGFMAIPIQVIPSVTKRGGGSGAKEGAFTIMVRDIVTGVFIPGSFVASRSDGVGLIVVEPSYPTALDEKTDIKGVAVAYSNNSRFVMNISFLLIDKATFGL